jgi:hypothetical protein
LLQLAGIGMAQGAGAGEGTGAGTGEGDGGFDYGSLLNLLIPGLPQTEPVAEHPVPTEWPAEYGTWEHIGDGVYRSSDGQVWRPGDPTPTIPATGGTPQSAGGTGDIDAPTGINPIAQPELDAVWAEFIKNNPSYADATGDVKDSILDWIKEMGAGAIGVLLPGDSVSNPVGGYDPLAGRTGATPSGGGGSGYTPITSTVKGTTGALRDLEALINGTAPSSGPWLGYLWE